MIEALALIAHPAPRSGEVDPPEEAAQVREQVRQDRVAYAENLRTMLDATDEDPLLAELRHAAERRDSAEAHVRSLLAYARRFTGARPDYTWESLAEAARLPYSTARRAVGEREVEMVCAALGATSEV